MAAKLDTVLTEVERLAVLVEDVSSRPVVSVSPAPVKAAPQPKFPA